MQNSPWTLFPWIVLLLAIEETSSLKPGSPSAFWVSEQYEVPGSISSAANLMMALDPGQSRRKELVSSPALVLHQISNIC